MKQFRPRSLAQYVEVIEELQHASGGPLWYRGSSNSKHPLLPSLFRKRQRRIAPDGLSDLEEALVTRFRERSIPFQQRPLGSDQLETLFLMQHFGVPTRLLDWSENPFAGLFFALRHAPHRRGKTGSIIFRRQAIVWVLDPTLWNRGSLWQRGFKGGVLSPSHEILGAYREIGRIEDLAPGAIALYGAHNSPRIVAQQGVFVLFGSDERAMETVVRQPAFHERCLMRIVITTGVVGKLRDALWRHGLTDASLFPDLEGLGRDLRRTYGFDI